MIDHLSIKVRDLAVMASYYERVLGTLGYKKGIEYPGGTQFVDEASGDNVWISPLPEGVDPVPMHVAWVARSADDVQEFYREALAAGGADNGAPGPRDYHPGYYACFVHDPEGNNIEAVIHTYEG